jgi:hypothetical protein
MLLQTKAENPLFSASNVLKVDVTEVEKCGGVASAFKMKQLKGVSIHNLLNHN